jgi:plasmid stabilization system protein ParE
VKLIVSAEAIADLDRLRAFLADKNPDAARRAIELIGTAIQSLDTFPGRGLPTAAAGVRELIVPFGNSAYVLRYAYETPSQEVVVLRVWHGREWRE